MSKERARVISSGRAPCSIDYSPLGKTAYVAAREGGVITVINRDHDVATQIKADPGLCKVQFVPGGRLAFVLNDREHVAHMLHHRRAFGLRPG